MPGSSSAPTRRTTRNIAPRRVTFGSVNSVGTPDICTIAAQWLARAYSCQRFAVCLTTHHMTLGQRGFLELRCRRFPLFTPSRSPGALTVLFWPPSVGCLSAEVTTLFRPTSTRRLPDVPI